MTTDETVAVLRDERQRVRIERAGLVTDLEVRLLKLRRSEEATLHVGEWWHNRRRLR